MNSEERSFVALKTIKSGLNSHSSLSLISSEGERWDAYFNFSLPATSQEIECIRSRWYLPNSYEEFLKWCNGATLFKEVTYGQWGFLLYSTEELIEKNALWHRLYQDMPSTYYVFAESLGDSDLLIIDTNSSSSLGGECNIIDGDVGYSVNQWSVIEPSFSEWIDHLVEVNGEKYWR